MTTSNELDDSAVIELTGKIMVVAVIVLFAVVVLVFFLHLYAKWFFRHRDTTTTTTTPIPRRLSTHGLDLSILKSIPVVIFPTSTKQEEQGLECAVCLSQFSQGDKARLLPKCNHGFHVECIDMWFQSHSTCPICRNPLSHDLQRSNSSSSVESRIEIPSAASPPEEEDVSLSLSTTDDESHVSSFPTNVLFWGNETQVNNQIQPPPPQLPIPSSSTSTSSTRGDEAIVIEIPRQVIEDESNSKSPVPTRMRSFKRLLSRDTTRISPTVVHVEQVARAQS